MAGKRFRKWGQIVPENENRVIWPRLVIVVEAGRRLRELRLRRPVHRLALHRHLRHPVLRHHLRHRGHPQQAQLD